MRSSINRVSEDDEPIAYHFFDTVEEGIEAAKAADVLGRGLCSSRKNMTKNVMTSTGRDVHQFGTSSRCCRRATTHAIHFTTTRTRWRANRDRRTDSRRNIRVVKSLRLRLVVDLTRYHPALRAGAEGVTVGQSGMWSRGSDRFVGVRFNEAGLHDILWESLEIFNEEYLREQAEAREKER